MGLDLKTMIFEWVDPPISLRQNLQFQLSSASPLYAMINQFTVVYSQFNPAPVRQEGHVPFSSPNSLVYTRSWEAVMRRFSSLKIPALSCRFPKKYLSWPWQRRYNLPFKGRRGRPDFLHGMRRKGKRTSLLDLLKPLLQTSPLKPVAGLWPGESSACS